jgi:hypothetical protein
MARKHVKPHAVLSSKEEEDIVFGKARAKGWMEGKPMGGGSSRLEIKKKKKRGGTVSRKEGSALGVSPKDVKQAKRHRMPPISPGLKRAMDRKLGQWRAKKASKKGLRGVKRGGKIMQGYKAGGKV